MYFTEYSYIGTNGMETCISMLNFRQSPLNSVRTQTDFKNGKSTLRALRLSFMDENNIFLIWKKTKCYLHTKVKEHFSFRFGRSLVIHLLRAYASICFCLCTNIVESLSYCTFLYFLNVNHTNTIWSSEMLTRFLTISKWRWLPWNCWDDITFQLLSVWDV